jgi:hypothetical protein
MQQDGLILHGIGGSGDVYLDIMKIICGDTSGKSMCDLCCHHAPYTSQLGYRDRTYVDIQNRPLDNLAEQQFFVQADIFNYLKFDNGHFDDCILSDAMEHFKTEDGYYLLGLMRRKSLKQIIFTPLGAYMVDETSTHPDSHKSGWTPEMLFGWLSIVLPDFHPSLKTGAFFAVNCSDEEKERIYNEIKNKYDKD